MVLWNAGDEMLGRDAFDGLDEDDQDAILATVKYWGVTSNAASTSPSLGSTKSTMIQRFSRSRPASIALPSFTPALTSGSYATITRNKNEETGQDRKSVSSTNDRGHGRLCSTNGSNDQV